MKRFLGKIALWILPIIFIHLFLGYQYAGGNTDDYYRHFTEPKPQNIILGDSRSSQGIVPTELSKVFPDKKFDNFSFNIVSSPYGNLYYEALKRKLNPNAKNGIFILTVSPWSISTSKNSSGKESFPEEERSPLKNMYFYDCSPNYEYLIKNYSKTWYYLYRDREEQGRSSTYLHKDGWMEVSVSIKEKEMKKSIKEKIKLYQSNAKSQSISQSRIKSLEDIIQFLQPKGKVYLVRIPTGEEITDIEKKYTPDFDVLVSKIADQYHLKYFNFADQENEYHFTDGNHLYKESSKLFTRCLADSIKKYNTNQ